MLISREPDVPASSSSSPFPSQGWSSTNPFGTASEHECGADVLVIEDDVHTAEWIDGRLRANGFNVVVAASGEEGLAVLAQRTFAIILLDWRLPGCDGIDVLRVRRACGDRTPIFVLSGFDAMEQRICAFENGADDFLVKPFAFPELLARVRARLRRASRGENMQWRISDLVLQVESRRVCRAGQEISLTPREFDLLLFLVLHHRTTVTREMLGREVWRVARQTPSLHNSIDVHIAHLRRKIDSGHDVKLIHTVRGEGFVLSESTAAESCRR
jgi:DNA-binding response OmpR family regulator